MKVSNTAKITFVVPLLSGNELKTALKLHTEPCPEIGLYSLNKKENIFSEWLQWKRSMSLKMASSNIFILKVSLNCTPVYVHCNDIINE